MSNETTFTLDAAFGEDRSVYVWAFAPSKQPVPVERWRTFAFMWHEASFFGSFVEEDTFHGKPAVKLSPWLALDFFARRPYSSHGPLRFSETIIDYERIAKALFSALRTGAYAPSFTAWQKGSFSWTIDTIAEPFAQDWFTAALRELTAEEDEVRTAWSTIQEQYPLIAANEQTRASLKDERFWYERIGWRKDETPFTVGLRLTEPEDEKSIHWALHITLRSKEHPEQFFIFTEDTKGTLPAAWLPSLPRVQEECHRWCELQPTLQAEDGSLRTTLTEGDVWTFLIETSEQLIEAGTEVLLPAWWKELQATKPKLNMHVRSSVGRSGATFVGLDQLIDFDWQIATGDITLSEAEFQQLVAENRRLVKLRGQWVKLDPTFIKNIQALMQRGKERGITFAELLTRELGQGEAHGEDDWLADVTIELNKPLLTMLKQLTETKQLPEVAVPESLQGDLRPYQKKGMEWLLFLRTYRLGALLADDMGLGKTIQMIAYSLVVREQEQRQAPILIICPTSVLGNWQREFARFAPSLDVHLHYGPNRETTADGFAKRIAAVDVVMTSYTLAQIDTPILEPIPWQAICLDEAQNIKNVYTKQAQAVKKLQAEHRIALTGTPIENRLTELWSLFDFLNRGYFGSLRSFQQTYVHPIEREQDKEKMHVLQRLIQPFFMRRSKLDPEIELDLPDKVEQKEYCPLTAEQALLYEQVVADTFHDLQSRTGIERRGYVLSLLTKLKQICNHPALYLKEEKPENVIARSYKMEKLIELITEMRAQRESCLIFTQYIAMGQMLKKTLQQTFAEKVSFLHGGLTKKERDGIISRFQQGEEPILILSLKAGGTGLNLTAANHVIHYDRWWNPAVENQATDRAHRIGQKRFVHVHKLMTTGTLEEKIDDMLERKQALSEGILQSEQWITELPTEQLRELLTLQQA